MTPSVEGDLCVHHCRQFVLLQTHCFYKGAAVRPVHMSSLWKPCHASNKNGILKKREKNGILDHLVWWAIALSYICIILLNGQDDKKTGGVCGSGPRLTGLPLVPTMQGGTCPPHPGIWWFYFTSGGRRPREVRTLPAITALDADSGPGAQGPAQPAWRVAVRPRRPGPQIWASCHLPCGADATFSPFCLFHPYISVSEASCAVRDLTVPFFAVKM